MSQGFNLYQFHQEGISSWWPLLGLQSWCPILTLSYCYNFTIGCPYISANDWLDCICLTQWGRVTHICVGKQTSIGSNNGLSPERRQAIIWINAGIFLIGPLGTNLSEILIEFLTFSFKKMRLKVSSVKRLPFCLGLNVLTMIYMSFRTHSGWRDLTTWEGTGIVVPIMTTRWHDLLS